MFGVCVLEVLVCERRKDLIFRRKNQILVCERLRVLCQSNLLRSKEGMKSTE